MVFVATLSVVGILQLASPFASAQFDASKNQACEGLKVGDEFIDCGSEAQSGGGVSSIMATVLNVLSLVAGIIAVVMIIIGGIKFMTSRGDPSATASARNTIIYAIVGIIIVVLAQSIVFFVLKKTTETDPKADRPINTCSPTPNNPC